MSLSLFLRVGAFATWKLQQEPQWLQYDARWPQDGLKIPQEGSKTAPTRPSENLGPRPCPRGPARRRPPPMRGLDQNTRSWRNIRIKTFQVEARPVRPYLLGGRRMWRKPENPRPDHEGGPRGRVQV